MYSAISLFRNNYLASRLGRNIGWNVLSGLGARIIGPLCTIVSVRFLSPADVGLFGVGIGFLAFFLLVSDLGLGHAIIADEKDLDHLSIQFTVQFIWSVILYALLFSLAPFLAYFMEMPELTNLQRIIGLTLILNAWIEPLSTYHMKRQNYQLLLLRQLIPSLVGGIATCWLAYAGQGTTALIGGMLGGQIILLLFLILKSDHTPSIILSAYEPLRLFKIGKHILFQKCCGFFVNQADLVVIGKFLGSNAAGFYRLSQQVIYFFPNFIIPPIEQVLFSELAATKGDIVKLTQSYYAFLFRTFLFCAIVSVGLFIFMPLVLPLLWGSQWGGAISSMRILSLSIATGFAVLMNSDIAKIYNFSHVYSWYAIFRALSSITCIILGSLFSLQIAVAGWVFAGLLGNTINTALFFLFQQHIKFQPKVVVLFVLAWVWFVVGLLIIFCTHY